MMNNFWNDDINQMNIFTGKNLIHLLKEQVISFSKSQ